MPIYKGSGGINMAAIYQGTVAMTRVYYGEDLVWEASSGLPRTAVVKAFTGRVNDGTTNYTSAALSGATPKAAILISSLHNPSNDPNATAAAVFSWGFLQGSVQRCIQDWSRDGNSTTSNARRAFADRVVFVSQTGGTTMLNVTGAAITDGLALTYVGTNGGSCRIGYMAFDCDSAKAGTIALGTGTSAITVSGVGFQADALILMSHNDDIAGSETTTMQYTFGFATSDGTQRCVAFREANGQADGAPFQAIFNDCGAAAKDSAATASKMVIGNFGSDGFDVTPSASQGSDDLIYLALKQTSGRAVKIVDFTTPTSTGSSTITGAGFTPQCAIVVLTNLEAINFQDSVTSDLQGGLSITLIGDEVISNSWSVDAGAATTNTGSQSLIGSLIGPSATDEDAIIATLTAFTSDGMTLNYSVVQGTGKKGFILFIE